MSSRQSKSKLLHLRVDPCPVDPCPVGSQKAKFFHLRVDPCPVGSQKANYFI